MNEDRELLERAAKAAGFAPVRLTDDGTALLLEGVQQPWNALHENPHSDCMGDALRLAVNLMLDVDCGDNRGPFVHDTHRQWHEPWGDDRAAATRRAIVRAAASIAPATPKGME